ncbi:MAG: LysE family transporter [Myxococcales bacterium]|nr:LysE family transporter [Myxococcales bacterium]
MKRGASYVLLVTIIGFLFGFVGSMPVAGPIALLVFSRGLEGKSRAGLHIAIGAAIAEAIYAYLAFWGFSELLESNPWVGVASRVGGAGILVALGTWFLLRRPKPTSEPKPRVARRKGVKRNVALGFVITGLNPALIATWGAAVTTLYSVMPVEFNADHALPFSLGACAGIASWFSLLLVLLARFRNRFRADTLNRASRAAGILILCAGIALAARAAFTLLEPG